METTTSKNTLHRDPEIEELVMDILPYLPAEARIILVIEALRIRFRHMSKRAKVLIAGLSLIAGGLIIWLAYETFPYSFISIAVIVGVLLGFILRDLMSR